MQPTALTRKIYTGLMTATLALVVSFIPVTLNFDNGQLSLKPAAAFAKDGEKKNDDSKDDDEKDDDHKDDDNKNDDGGRNDDSHKGGNSGPGKNSGGDDDNGGANDDHHGGNSRDMFAGNNRPESLGDFIKALNNGSAIVSAEMNGDNIEIVYSDGWKEEISDGTYEIVNPSGRAIVHRPVNANDISRLSSVF
ncbi:MAG: hypothetical protein KDJ19_10380 [Hyphomicrobiaceae bacterium]|nr:hypothetical protein [Hyphomicrobiaceae bacterium]MCC0024194.1 hypothetical protein [Hyphomicrobiaceae bacterium]